MLTPSEFVERWRAEVAARSRLPDDERLVTAPPESLGAGANARLPDDTRRFLAEAGLPASCAPCLTFDEVGRGLPGIADVFSPGRWSGEERARVEHYRMIGSDGAGNPLCVDARDGRVFLVDHEDHFRTTQFMNTSVAHLAECLLAFHTAAPADRRQALRRVDALAVDDGAFWSYETAPEAPAAAPGAPAKRPWWKIW
jgi:hypothetical protein